MHGAGVAAGAVLQHAKAIDDDVDGMVAQELGQRGGIHRHHRELKVERTAHLRGGKASRDADDMKAPRTQIVGDEAADQAGGAEHEDLALRIH